MPMQKNNEKYQLRYILQNINVLHPFKYLICQYRQIPLNLMFCYESAGRVTARHWKTPLVLHLKLSGPVLLLAKQNAL
jgi:hypothetical protein